MSDRLPIPEIDDEGLRQPPQIPREEGREGGGAVEGLARAVAAPEEVDVVVGQEVALGEEAVHRAAADVGDLGR